MMIRLSTDEPKIDSSISAKISCGIDISTSTTRDRSWSSQPRVDRGEEARATRRSAKDRSVVMTAMPMVLRAP